MVQARAIALDRGVDAARDHVIGDPDAEMELVEYGSYACAPCRVAQEVVKNLLEHFGERMCYVFRHRPVSSSQQAEHAARFAEYVAATGADFWPVHVKLMTQGSALSSDAIDRIAKESGVAPLDEADPALLRKAATRVEEDADSARNSGALVSPTFFINDRRYEGPWDESSLSDALVGSVGHRLRTASLDFVRWGPSAGLLLLLMSVVAVLLANSAAASAFAAIWKAPLGFQLGSGSLALPLIEWVNDGLLAIFFLVVGLEIKREFTVGHLATPSLAALPVAASIGGMIIPVVIYIFIAPGDLKGGWAIPLSTDTAFAVALIVMLGERVPVQLRVFLTAAVIIDDLCAIAIIALFYSDHIEIWYVLAAVALTGVLMTLNHWAIYRALPYGLVGIFLWFCLHQSGLHATLAGVILALTTPTRPPANFRALTAQARTVMAAEAKYSGDDEMRRGPSETALRALDAIHSRIESPASKLLRAVEPWSSYLVLPIFALANAGVVLSVNVMEGHGLLMLAIAAGLVIGKPVGITSGAWLAVHLGVAVKPEEYNWRQLIGVGALAGIGFTMSLFIASETFSGAEFASAKIGIFAASLIAGCLGTMILWKPAERPDANSDAMGVG